MEIERKSKEKGQNERLKMERNLKGALGKISAYHKRGRFFLGGRRGAGKGFQSEI
jgi:hypothetical protein